MPFRCSTREALRQWSKLNCPAVERRLPREQVLFVAFAGWDAAGASRFGYQTYWVNRMKLPAEELGHVPDGIGRSLDDLVSFLAARQ